MGSKAKPYEAPKVTITTFCSDQCLLITSNEGLEYEDLFSPVPTAFSIDEDPFAIIP